MPADSAPRPEEPRATQTLPVYGADAMRVISGVAEGDAMGFADELVLDDIYALLPGSARQPLTVTLAGDNAPMRVADGSATGRAGNAVALDCCLTFMAEDGATHEALVLVEVEDSTAAAVYVLPLAAFAPKSGYRLVGVDRAAAARRFAEVAVVSFTRGTRITMATGEQRPIEALRVGDRVLTRDDGPQAIRWIGSSTVRGVGASAPVVITRGTLNNENDLVVSPDHRLFVWQRSDRLGAGRSEVLVKVRHLVNGTSVYQRPGGFVEYFQLLFDAHQIIYAEGIAAESLMVDPRTRAALPPEVQDRLDPGAAGHADRPHLAYELREALARRPDAADLLRRASTS